MTLTDADLVRAHRDSKDPNPHLNPAHVEGLRRVEAAVREDVLDRDKLTKTLRDAIPHSETSYTNVFIGWAVDALVRGLTSEEDAGRVES